MKVPAKVVLPGLWERIQVAFGGINAARIATELGLSKPAVYRWREGELPSIQTLVKISESTSTSLPWLLTGQGNHDSRQVLGVVSAAVEVDGDRVVRVYLAERLAELVEKQGSNEVIRYLIKELARLSAEVGNVENAVAK